MQCSLADAFCYLMSLPTTSFYAWVLSGLTLSWDKRFPAMAVSITRRMYTLHINPVWYANATFAELLGVIKHEVYHITGEHIPRSMEMYASFVDEFEKRLFNTVQPFAVDCAVNTLLRGEDEFIEGAINKHLIPNPGDFGLPEKMSLEFYVKRLMDDNRNDIKRREELSEILRNAFAQVLQEALDQQQQNTEENNSGADGNSEDAQGDSSGSGKGRGADPGSDGSGGSHSRGAGRDASGTEGEGEEGGGGAPSLRDRMLASHHPGVIGEIGDNVEDILTMADELRRQARSVIQKAVDVVKGRGTLPADLQEQIDRLLAKPQIPFTHILRSWVLFTQKHSPMRSMARPRRRYMGVPELMPFPGIGRDRKFTIVWCTDTSGSMGSAELEMGLNELAGLQRADKEIEVIVLEADAAVEHEYRLSNPTQKINYEVHGRGGTCFDPALIRAQELEADIVFYFTDGYAPAPAVENRVRCPFAWIITPRGQIPDKNWGRVIQTR